MKIFDAVRYKTLSDEERQKIQKSSFHRFVIFISSSFWIFYSLTHKTLCNEDTEKIQKSSFHRVIICFSFLFPIQIFNSYSIHQEAIKHRIGQMQLQKKFNDLQFEYYQKPLQLYNLWPRCLLQRTTPKSYFFLFLRKLCITRAPNQRIL